MSPTLIALALLAPAPAIAPEAPVGLRCLVESYPDHLCGATVDALLWCDGTRMPWRTREPPADLDERLNTADLADQMSQRYPPGRTFTIPPPEDPGRLRHQPFFLKMVIEPLNAIWF